MQKNMIIVAVVVVALIGAGGAVLVLGGNHSNSNPYGSVDSKLLIRGNVNEDYTIDGDDMSLFEEVKNGDKSLTDYPYADVNGDGDVNDDDKALLQDLIDRKAGTDVYIDCLDITAKPANVKAKYPLRNIVPFGTDMMTVMWAGGGEYVAGYFYNSYPNIQNTPNGEAFGNSIMPNAAAWQKFQARDATLKENGGNGIGGIILNTAYVKFITSQKANLEKAGIPVIGFPSLDAESEITAILTIGFLFGTDNEKSSLEYAEKGWEVVKEVKDKVKDLKDDERKTFIAFCMTNYICANDSTMNGTALSAGGIHYSKVDKEYAATYAGSNAIQMGSTEALANYSADVFINITSQDSVKDKAARQDKMVTIWESAMAYYQNHESYKNTVYLNLTLPDACRLAYVAAALYPEIFSMDWANGIMQDYIDAGFGPLKDKTMDENLITVVTYEDYQNLKK